jgi:hyperosmotically inducible periplasmic protein
MWQRHFYPALIALCLVTTFPVTSIAQTTAGAQAQKGGKFDAQIQEQLTKKFGGKSEFKNAKYVVEDGVVTLTGSVDKLVEKERAEERAHDIDHVQGVRNQLQVAGPEVSDQELSEKLANKLRYDRIGQGIIFNALGLEVNNGVVTIKGTVRDEPDRASALAIVANTPGVKEVRDDIEVAPASLRDDELRIQLARAIYGDPALSRYANDPQAPIRIVVNRGHVELWGVVDSEVSKNIAYARASSVPGIFSVKNNIVVAGKENETPKE